MGDRLKITVQLIRAEDGFHLWSETYDKTSGDLLDMQADIAEKIARIFIKDFSLENSLAIREDKPANAKANEYFLKGLYFHERYRRIRSESNFRVAKANFMQSIGSDPEYAAAYGELANLYDSYGGFNNRLYFNRRDSLIEVGMKINPNSVNLLLVKSWALGRERLQDSAFFYIKKVYKINPESPLITWRLAEFYRATSGLDSLAERFVLKAISSDPLAILNYLSLYDTYRRRGDFEKSISVKQKILEIDPTNFEIHRLLCNKAVYDKDEDELNRLLKILHGYDSLSTVDMNYIKFFDRCLKVMRGDKTAAIIQPGYHLNNYIIFYLLNDKDKMLTYLDSIQNPFNLEKHYVFDPIRNEPHFKVIQNRINEKIKSDKVKNAKYATLE